jgi:hypothetical protein
VLQEEELSPDEVASQAGDSVVSPAAETVRRHCSQQKTGPATQLSLMMDGVVEWVRGEHSWVGIGSPRQNFYPHSWHPLHDVWRPIQTDERLMYFGFRVVYRV